MGSTPGSSKIIELLLDKETLGLMIEPIKHQTKPTVSYKCCYIDNVISLLL